MLYKVRRIVGDHGVSVFPPEDQELPESEELAGDPWIENFRKLRFLGFTDAQAGMALKAWAYHAKHTLHQGAVGVRVFVEQCVNETTLHVMPPEPIAWSLVMLVAVIVAVALGLYLWVTLDVEKNKYFGSHKWAYVMKYEERLWQGEIFAVLANGEGVYEVGGELFSGSFEHRRNDVYLGRLLDRFLFYRRFRLEGRRLVFYHEYRWVFWDAFWVGCLTHIRGRKYRLRKGGDDPYKPRGLWFRPGGPWGTPQYRGCWEKWWWL